MTQTTGLTSIQIVNASGPHKVWKIGKLVEKLRKKLSKILGSYVSVARATTGTNDILPDDVLLQIFDFCRVGDHHPLELPTHPALEWHRLVHVCRRWRQIIFSSTRRLDLSLLCKQGTPVRKNLGLWPALPIIIHYADHLHCIPKRPSHDEDSIIAALEHPDRVRRLKFPMTSSLSGKLATVARAQEPFPILTQLWLSSEDGCPMVLLSAFLGGLAPRLREIHLEGVFFPTLPTLLLSASDLAVLHLHRLPHTRYISAEAMVASLAALTRLHDLSIDFVWTWSTSLPDQSGRAAPPTRVVLPVLTFFRFQGVSGYLEDLVAQIDAPCLTSIRIKCFDQLIFQVPQLFRFICQNQIFEQALTMNAEVHFCSSYVKISLSAPSRRIFLEFQISCQGLDSQVSHLAEALSQSSMILFNVHHLFMLMYSSQLEDVDNIEWLALLRRFTAVETLVLPHGLARPITDALNEVTVAMAPEILPALRLLHMISEGAGCVEEFVATRQLSGLPPITITSANTIS
jgi:hypothetical protein